MKITVTACDSNGKPSVSSYETDAAGMCICVVPQAKRPLGPMLADYNVRRTSAEYQP